MSFTVRPLKEEKAPSLGKLRRIFSITKPAFGVISRLAGPLFLIAGIWQRHHEKKKEETERINLLKRVLIILVTIFCAFLLFAATTKALISLKILSLQNFVNVAGSDLLTDTYGHTNILLLGAGDESHDGVDLTDTIMVASLDPEKTKSAVLLSLPRDLYFLETEKMGEGRINSLYRDYKILLANEGMSEAEASRESMRELAVEIGRKLGINMHYAIKVDFIAFVQAVDAIGGIDIVVPEKLVDVEYPGPNYTYETFQIEAGPQHIDGETALKYARSRHSTSDFDRSKRQQQIIKAIADKMQEEGLLGKPRQIMDLMSIMNEHVESTMQLSDMISLADTGKSIDRSKILSLQLNSENGLYGAFSSPGGMLYDAPRVQFEGAAVLLPVSIPPEPITWTRIQGLVKFLVHDRVAHLEKAPIVILNAGAEQGSARSLGGELIRWGFNVVEMDNAEEDVVKSRITGNPDSPTAILLTRLLQMDFNALPPMPASEGAQTAAEPITIELGEEYEYSPLQP
jgi:LCP family protein required for cell wall assembly